MMEFDFSADEAELLRMLVRYALLTGWARHSSVEEEHLENIMKTLGEN